MLHLVHHSARFKKTWRMCWWLCGKIWHNAGGRLKAADFWCVKIASSQRCIGWSDWVVRILGNTKNISANFIVFACLSASPIPNTNHKLYGFSSLLGNIVTPNVYFSLCAIFLCPSKVQYNVLSVLREAPKFFQSDFLTECHLVFSVSVSSML